MPNTLTHSRSSFKSLPYCPNSSMRWSAEVEPIVGHTFLSLAYGLSYTDFRGSEWSKGPGVGNWRFLERGEDIG